MKAMRRISAAVLLAALLLALLAVSETASAADRSPEGAVVMPSNRTLFIKAGKSKKINFGYEYDYSKNYYFKIKPKKTGFITFRNDYTHGYSIALLNAKKKIVSRDCSSDCFLSAGSQYIYQRSVAFGVKKGRTYYVRVKGASTERESYDSPYVGTVRYTMTGVSGRRFGKSRKRAVRLKRYKTKKGLIIAGVKGSQWYKIKSVRKKTRIWFKGKFNSGTLKARVFYKSYGRWYSDDLSVMRSSDYWKNGCKITSNRKHNTYYIKVYRKGKSTGKYTLRWK